jgi:hypothetical protein
MYITRNDKIIGVCGHISDPLISATSILLNFSLTPVITLATHKGSDTTTITVLVVARVAGFQHYHQW